MSEKRAKQYRLDVSETTFSLIQQGWSGRKLTREINKRFPRRERRVVIKTFRKGK